MSREPLTGHVELLLCHRLSVSFEAPVSCGGTAVVFVQSCGRGRRANLVSSSFYSITATRGFGGESNLILVSVVSLGEFERSRCCTTTRLSLHKDIRYTPRTRSGHIRPRYTTTPRTSKPWEDRRQGFRPAAIKALGEAMLGTSRI